MFGWFVFFNETATTEIDTYWHTLSLPYALPICAGQAERCPAVRAALRQSPHDAVGKARRVEAVFGHHGEEILGGERPGALGLLGFAAAGEGHHHAGHPRCQDLHEGVVATLADRQAGATQQFHEVAARALDGDSGDRKSTRLNSS